MQYLAFAQAAGTAATATPQTAASSQLLLIGGMAIIFYFIVIRPQQKRYKEHQNLLGNLRRGDKIVTGGGIVGTITRIEDKEDLLEVEIAPEVKVKVLRSTVTNIMGKPQPAANDAAPAKPAKKAPVRKSGSKTAEK